MYKRQGISGGTAIVILIALYFVIKWAVKNGIKEAYSAITAKHDEVKQAVDKYTTAIDTVQSNINRMKQKQQTATRCV